MKLSEEEKTAIELLNSYINAIDTFGTIDPKCCNNLYKPTKTVLDIIENLQKEIDNWKFTAKYVEDNYVHKDKIRKILEYYEHTPADNPDTTIAFYADIKKLLGGIKDE